MKKILLLLAAVGTIFTACQSGGDNEENGSTPSIPKIELSQQIIEVGFKADTYSVSVTSPYSWEAESKNDWIIVDNTTGIAGTEVLRFSVARNDMEEVRKGTILLINLTYNLAAELYIVQKASAPEISVDKSELNFAAEGGSQDISITTNLEYTVSTTANWISYIQRSHSITVIVSNNVETKERNAEITLYNNKYNISNDIKIHQRAFSPELELLTSTTSYKCGYEDSEFTVAVSSNFNYDVTTTVDWLKCTKTEEGVKISMQKNYYTESRTAEVKIYSERYNLKGETITVIQGASPMEIGAIVTRNGIRGVVFYIDNSITKIVSVEETNLAWSTEDVTTGATDLNNGANNMAKIKSISGWESKYPAFKWCADYGEGWYLPARNELSKIFGNQTINDTLKANGYTAIGMNYFSSTETGSSTAWGLFDNMGYYYHFNKGDLYRVRAILAF